MIAKKYTNFLTQEKDFKDQDAKIVAKILKFYNLEINEELSKSIENTYAAKIINESDGAIIRKSPLEIRLNLANKLRTDNKTIRINNNEIEMDGIKILTLPDEQATKIGVKYKLFNGSIIICDAFDEYNVFSSEFIDPTLSPIKIIKIAEETINKSLEHLYFLYKLPQILNKQRKNENNQNKQLKKIARK